MLIIVPEIIIRDTVQKTLELIKQDYNNNVNEQNTILYKLLADQKLGRYGLFEQAKSIFIKQDSDPRKISVNVMFNRDKIGPPAIHITLPSEDEVNQTLGIGEGELEYFHNADDELEYRRTFNKRFRASFNIVVTSDNVNEVILMYYVIRALFIGVLEQFYGYCMYNFKISGRDLMLSPDIVPTHIFMRSLGISFEYETGATEFNINDYLKNVNFEGTIDDERTNEL